MNKRHLRKVEAGKGEKQKKNQHGKAVQLSQSDPRAWGRKFKIPPPKNKRGPRNGKQQQQKKNIAGIKTACRGRAATADKQLNCGDEEWKIKYTKYSLDQQGTKLRKQVRWLNWKTQHKTLNKDIIINTWLQMFLPQTALKRSRGSSGKDISRLNQ